MSCPSRNAGMDRRAWLVTAVASAVVVACGGSDSPVVLAVNADGVSTVDSTALADSLATYPLGVLSAAERDSLLYMREEEQLAHDVYAVSATIWPQPVFANIRDSEATHSAAIKALLDRYGLPDPLAGLPSGSFKSASFQTLYQTLVARSRSSLVEALRVGVEIEELDIRDITAQKVDIDNADILLVYDHLLRGSRNHLRAFMKVLTQLGGSYVPIYISQAAFDAIVSSPVETGP